MTKKRIAPDTLLNPMPVVMASCQLPNDKPNLITLAWAGVACSKPPMISIAIRPSRYSYDIIKKTGEFVIVIPDRKMLEAVDYCGCVSGRKVDKFEKTGLTPIAASEITPPLVLQAPVNLECKVSQILALGVHHLFLGEILAVHLDDNVSTEGKKIDVTVSNPIVYCYGSREYRAVGEKLGTHGFAMKRF